MVKSHMIRGEASYAKILGKAPPGYDNGPAQWVLDLVLDDNSVKDYLETGGSDFYIKSQKDTGKPYLRFVRNALRKDGTEAKPIIVYDSDGKEWDQHDLIGNGSILNVKFTLNEIEHKKQKRLKPQVLAVQVWDHKKYVGKSDFPVKGPAQEDWSEAI